MRKLTILSYLFILAFNSCSNEEICNEVKPTNFEKRISVIAEDITYADDTRTSYTEKTDGTGYTFAWTQGDALGIFPKNGSQTKFPISNGYGTNTAIFDGGDWALKPNAKYAAYYPVNYKLDLDHTAIPIDYTGQVQDGNGSIAHLGKYDFMASTFTEVDNKGNVNFYLHHLGCLVDFEIEVPVADDFDKLEITSNGNPFIYTGYFRLDSTKPAIVSNPSTGSTFTISLEGIHTFANNQTLSIFAMMAPEDYSQATFTLTLTGEKVYKGEILGEKMRAGGLYVYSVSVSDLSSKNGLEFNTENDEMINDGEIIIKKQ